MKNAPFSEVLNRSINETLPRSILTHGTTLGTLLALAIFGGEVIRPFALVMFFGVFTGTFSSIYIASPVLMAIEQRWPGPRTGPLAPGSRAAAGPSLERLHARRSRSPETCWWTRTATSAIGPTTPIAPRWWRGLASRRWAHRGGRRVTGGGRPRAGAGGGRPFSRPRRGSTRTSRARGPPTPHSGCAAAGRPGGRGRRRNGPRLSL